MTKQTPSIGRIVHYKLESGPNQGEYRPAIIVRVWSDTCVQLQVFTDDTNDRLPCPYWATSRIEGDGLAQWIWPPYVAAKEAATA